MKNVKLNNRAAQALKVIAARLSERDLLVYETVRSSLDDEQVLRSPEAQLLLLTHQIGLPHRIVNITPHTLSGPVVHQLMLFTQSRVVFATEEAAMYTVRAWGDALGKKIQFPPPPQSPQPAVGRRTNRLRLAMACGVALVAVTVALLLTASIPSSSSKSEEQVVNFERGTGAEKTASGSVAGRSRAPLDSKMLQPSKTQSRYSGRAETVNKRSAASPANSGPHVQTTPSITKPVEPDSDDESPSLHLPQNSKTTPVSPPISPLTYDLDASTQFDPMEIADHSHLKAIWHVELLPSGEVHFLNRGSAVTFDTDKKVFSKRTTASNKKWFRKAQIAVFPNTAGFAVSADGDRVAALYIYVLEDLRLLVCVSGRSTSTRPDNSTSGRLLYSRTKSIYYTRTTYAFDAETPLSGSWYRSRHEPVERQLYTPRSVDTGDYQQVLKAFYEDDYIARISWNLPKQHSDRDLKTLSTITP